MSELLSVWIVDDDADQTDALRQGLQSVGIDACVFSSAEQLLSSTVLEQAECLIIDVQLPGMSGLELQAELRARQIAVPIIILTAFATVQRTIRAFDSGASAYFEKPVAPEVVVTAAQSIAGDESRRRQIISDRATRLAALSIRERQVMEQLIEGKGVKTIGRELGISPSTAEKHRASVLNKTGFDNLIDLTRFLLTEPPLRAAMANFTSRKFHGVDLSFESKHSSIAGPSPGRHVLVAEKCSELPGRQFVDSCQS